MDVINSTVMDVMNSTAMDVMVTASAPIICWPWRCYCKGAI